jgi:Ti-type conjugative transfer relaxase TraA
MAIYHLRIKMITRSKGNTVHKLAYNTATKLKCQRTQRTWDYTKKPVSKVHILLPEDAPQWAKDLQKLVEKDKQKGLNILSDLVEAAEKRNDSQVYRELEFALPRELTDEQNRKLAEEYIQDQCCKLGMVAIQAFHIDYDKKTGERNPHCHTLLLTRQLTETGLAIKKDRTWNQKIHHERWREQWAAYANFHLRLHGFEQTLDHRSNKEQGLELEPQSKLGSNIQEIEHRAGNDVKSLNCKAVTKQGIAYQAVKLRNMYLIIKRPEAIFEMVTKSQSTFMWGDVQKKLAHYVDDATLFQRLDAQLQASKELVLLRNIEFTNKDGSLKQAPVYTCKSMLQTEIELIALAESLSQTQSHKIKEKALNKAVARYNQKLEQHGGLSYDQVQAIKHMVQPHQLACVVGYAGAGKTTALSVTKEIWERSGYAVYGLAPTGRARENLKQSGFKSYTLHEFLQDYDNGRCQFRSKSILVLDEGGMVSTYRLQQFLEAAERLGVKAVVVGDGAQLQSSEAGPALRLVTERVGYAKLEHIVRQKVDWQKEATVLFGQNRTREALQKYHDHGCIQVCKEQVTSLDDLLKNHDYREVVLLYNLSRRLAGNIYHEMLADIKKHEPWKYIRTHRDYEDYREWRDRRDNCAKSILSNLDHCRSYLKELGVDPIKFALNFVDKELPQESQIKEAQQLAKKWQLPELDRHQKLHICDPRAQTKKDIVQNWYEAYQQNPDKPKLMMAYSNNDTRALNDQARFLLKQIGVIEKTEFTYTIIREEEDDFGKIITHKEERAFAKGDRLLFTHNDKGLGVNNGTLGTIESLNRRTIKVSLDDSHKIVSFAPKLYPSFDQGWAATIHKNQGATTKKALVLSSFEMSSNLTYVGMSRHEEEATLYCSDIDFWRIEKVFDRLSRPQEKLSSFDYIDAERLYELVQEDDQILTKLFGRVGNQLDAIKYVSKRAVQEVRANLFGKTYEYETPITQSSISEADRAWEFFDAKPRDVNLSHKKCDSNSQPAVDLLTAYQELKIKQSKYKILQLTPEERQDFLEINFAIKKTAHEIVQNSCVLMRTNQFGLQMESLKTESLLYEKEMKQEQDVAKILGKKLGL